MDQPEVQLHTSHHQTNVIWLFNDICLAASAVNLVIRHSQHQSSWSRIEKPLSSNTDRHLSNYFQHQQLRQLMLSSDAF